MSDRHMRGRRIGAALVAAMLLGAPLRAGEPAKPLASEEQRARDVLEEAVKKDPTNSKLWLHLGLAYKHLNDIDDAQKAFEKSVSLDPKNVGANFMLGLIYEKKRMKMQAIAAWTLCLSSPEEHIREIAENHLHHLSHRHHTGGQ